MVRILVANPHLPVLVKGILKGHNNKDLVWIVMENQGRNNKRVLLEQEELIVGLKVAGNRLEKARVVKKIRRVQVVSSLVPVRIVVLVKGRMDL
ncbi:MAG: hypothetical protein GY790_17900 [Bacteroidetes bacterium]|nr:hypothetical protein [Bacteroidota bacterium]